MSARRTQSGRTSTQVVLPDGRTVRSKVRYRGDDRLPLSEFTFDRAGAASPFGDDLAFPLPVAMLSYVHPSPDAAPQHL